MEFQCPLYGIYNQSWYQLVFQSNPAGRHEQ